MFFLNFLHSLPGKGGHNLRVILRDFDRPVIFAINGGADSTFDFFNRRLEIISMLGHLGVGRIPASHHRARLHALFHVGDMGLQFSGQFLVLRRGCSGVTLRRHRNLPLELLMMLGQFMNDVPLLLGKRAPHLGRST